MFRPRLRRADPFAAALLVYALALCCLGAFVGLWNPAAGGVTIIAALLIAAHGALVQRSVRE